MVELADIFAVEVLSTSLTLNGTELRSTDRIKAMDIPKILI